MPKQHTYSPPPQSADRISRTLTPEQTNVKAWIRSNHGVLSRIATECNVSVTFVNMIAYNHSSSASSGLRVERALLSRGCPLIQKI